jgi:hypothetical protein
MNSERHIKYDERSGTWCIDKLRYKIALYLKKDISLIQLRIIPGRPPKAQ